MRKAFVVADESTRMSMLGMFLGAAFAEMGRKEDIYIAGTDNPTHEIQ